MQSISQGKEMGEDIVLLDLGDGLVLRRAMVAGVESLAAFNADMLREHGAEEPDERAVFTMRDLMSGTHPTCEAGEFTPVEDTRSTLSAVLFHFMINFLGELFVPLARADLYQAAVWAIAVLV
jgi:hypothetical protein